MDFQDASNLRIPEGYVRTIHDKNNRLLWGSVGYDVSFDGDATQGSLPPQYQQIAYIEAINDGTSKRYIDTSIQLGTNDFEISCDVEFLTGAGYERPIFSIWTSSFGYWNVFKIGNDLDCYASVHHKISGGAAVDTLYRVKLKRVSNEWTLSNGVDNDITWTFAPSSTNNTTLKINTRGDVNDDGKITSARYYGITVKVGTSVIRNYVPAIRKSDSAVGLYDTVSGSFVSSAADAFTAGGNVPSPDSPQEIQTVTGEQEVKITGKNLLENKATTRTYLGVTLTKNDDGSVTLNGTSTGNAQFYMTYDGVGYHDRTLRLPAGTYRLNGLNNNGVKFECNYKIDGEAFSRYTAGSFVATAPITCGIYVTVQNGTTVNDLTIYPQLEVGSTATAYEQYQEQSFTIDLGSTELAKVGAYTDEITKVGTKWYVEKRVGKMVLDGSNSGITWARSTVGSNYAFWFRNNMTDALTNAHKKICDKFIYSNKSFLGAPSPSLCENSENYGPAAYMFIFKVPSSLATTIADWTTWLASNPTTVYYALATPTTTEITDVTLIAQLEAVYDWVRRHGYNAQVSGDLPIVINRTALPTA